MTYSGSCHCGAVQFTVKGDIPTEANSCNCSHCRRKGFLWTFVPAKLFNLVKGDGATTEYRFNTRKLVHKSCSTCGCQGFAEGQGKDGEETRAVNLRCVPDADLDALKIVKIDGASH